MPNDINPVACPKWGACDIKKSYKSLGALTNKKTKGKKLTKRDVLIKLKDEDKDTTKRIKKKMKQPMPSFY